MDKTIIELLMHGYDVQLSSLKTITGLHHPDSKDYVEIILLKRLPGMQRKGGSAFAKGKIPWRYLSDPVIMEEILMKDLLPKVETQAATRKGGQG